MEVYDGTRERVKELYRAIPGVTEVVEYGTVPLPGISDMDFIVVVEPHAKVDIPSLKQFTPEQRYAQEHSHYVVSETVIKSLRSFDPWIVNVFPRLDTHSLTMDDLEDHDEEGRHAISLDYIFTSWMIPSLQTIGRIHANDAVECREFFELIKGVKYCYREMKRAGACEHETTDDAEFFHTFQKQWFKMSDAEQRETVVSVVNRFERAVSDVCLTDAEALHERSVLRTVPGALKNAAKSHQIKLLSKYPHSIGIDLGSTILIYEQDRTKIEIDCTIFHSPVSKTTYEKQLILVPLSLSASQNRLLFEDGLVPDAYQKAFFTDLDEVPVFTHAALEKRTRVTNTMLEEIKNVRGGKILGKSYGFRYEAVRPGASKGTLRARLGGVFDRTMKKLTETPVGTLFKKQQAHVIL
jgi:hypothetical protein